LRNFDHASDDLQGSPARVARQVVQVSPSMDAALRRAPLDERYSSVMIAPELVTGCCTLWS
jgi:hypothetical protein